MRHASGYEVRRRDSNGLEAIVALPGPEYTDEEVSYEGVYAYSVRGVNAFGEGTWSSETDIMCSMMQYGGDGGGP